MQTEFRLVLVPGCRILESSAQRLIIDAPGKPVTLPDPPAGVRQAVQRLASGGAGEEELRALVSQRDGDPGIDYLYGALLALHRHLRLCHLLMVEDRAMMTLVPIAASYRLDVAPVPEKRRFIVSRFAHLRREANEWILESPLSPARAVFHDPEALEILSCLAAPGVPERTSHAAALTALLAHGLFLTEVDDSGTSAEERDPARVAWEFHDLLFHSRSRLGRHQNPYGSTDRLRGKQNPPPVIKLPVGIETVELHRPELARLLDEDTPFTRVLEDRCSRRRQGEVPITVDQLGEFLFRTARRKEAAADKRPAGRRVYPGGGGAYEIELYPLVHRCAGLEPGLYHYRPGEHRLALVSPPTPETERLLAGGAQAALTDTPQVLIILAARFQRLSWKYASAAYATILKDVGVLQQTMSLVASAMDLAACILGGGDSDLFARAAGTPYLEEGSVGELMLGNRAD